MKKALRLPCVFLLFLSLGMASVHAEEAAAPAPPAPYMRVHTDTNGVVELQIALREFSAVDGKGHRVALIGASHIGTPAYYDALQAYMDRQSVILFEGVGYDEAEAQAAAQTGQEAPAGFKRGEEEDPGLQAVMANSLGLVFQLDAIDYKQEHFINSDISIMKLQQLMQRRRADGGKGNAQAQKEMEKLMRMMDPGSWMNQMVTGVFRMIGANPKMQAMVRLTMIELLGTLGNDLEKMAAAAPGMEGLMEVLIGERNRVVCDDLEVLLKEPESIRLQVGIFYGAGHMADLETRLINDLGLQPCGEKWFTAFSVNPSACDLTPKDMKMVRMIVQWQLRSIKKMQR